MVLKHPNNQHIGGEKASRECPKCPSKNNKKKGNNEKSQLDRKPFSLGKYLSLGTVYFLQGISEILKSRLKIWTTGENTDIYRKFIIVSARSSIEPLNLCAPR